MISPLRRNSGVDVLKINTITVSPWASHPMATRGIIEVIEELAIRGGGYGLFSGCAAGDSAISSSRFATGLKSKRRGRGLLGPLPYRGFRSPALVGGDGRSPMIFSSDVIETERNVVIDVVDIGQPGATPRLPRCRQRWRRRGRARVRNNSTMSSR